MTVTVNVESTTSSQSPDHGATAIPADRARSLSRWNRVLSVLHGGQFLLMIAIASTAVAFAPFVPDRQADHRERGVQRRRADQGRALLDPARLVHRLVPGDERHRPCDRRLAAPGPLRGLARPRDESAALGRVQLQQHGDDRGDRLPVVHPGRARARGDRRRQRRDDPVRLEHGGGQRGSPRPARLEALHLRLDRRHRARGSGSSRSCSPTGPSPTCPPAPGSRPSST